MTSTQLAWLIRRHGIEMTHLSGGSHIGFLLLNRRGTFRRRYNRRFVCGYNALRPGKPKVGRP